MSDASCGPSNGLQQFKQHSQVDRTLQQDRLTGRQHPGQGFRSADPNAGLLDPEFEAFQAGLPPPEFQSFPPQQHAPQPFQQAFPGHSQGASWAGDFQRMSISSPPPMQQQQQPRNVGPSTSIWAQDFRSNITQSAPRAQNSSPSPFAFQQRARFGMNGGFQSNFAQPAYSPAMQSKGKEPATEQFDEAAFERAFDMAKEDMMVDTVPATASHTALTEEEMAAQLNEPIQESHQVNQNDLSGLEQEKHDSLEDFLRINEAIQEQQKQPEQNTRADDDALAATAQELLEKVQDNQTDKFRNSQFLGLMRKLRDREVKVEGDKMVETTATASTTSTETQTQTLNPPTSSTRFNNSEQIPRAEQDHDPLRDGADVVNLLSQPGLPGGSPSSPPSLEPESDPSNLDFAEDMERRRLGDMWRSMLPSASSSSSGLDRRTHSAAAEEGAFKGTAFSG